MPCARRWCARRRGGGPTPQRTRSLTRPLPRLQGPLGMDKLIHGARGTTISNDGATIMKVRRRRTRARGGRPTLSDSGGSAGARSHASAAPSPRPAARHCAPSREDDGGDCQEPGCGGAHPPPRQPLRALRPQLRLTPPPQVGDGTTTVVLLAGELLREAKPFIEDGVHPQLLIRAYRQACTLAVETVKKMSIRCAGLPPAQPLASLTRASASPRTTRWRGRPCCASAPPPR